jgi:hypothetical protein
VNLAFFDIYFESFQAFCRFLSCFAIISHLRFLF